jgi:hypothetical protein
MIDQQQEKTQLFRNKVINKKQLQKLITYELRHRPHRESRR